jgi:hypothetical protein
VGAEAETEVQELVVTARKRDEQLIDVPFSVAAQSEAVMRNRGCGGRQQARRHEDNTEQRVSHRRLPGPAHAGPPVRYFV